MRSLLAFALDVLRLAAPPVNACGSPRGWRCTRWPGHGGPCALTPRWFNPSRFARSVRRHS